MVRFARLTVLLAVILAACSSTSSPAESTEPDLPSQPVVLFEDPAPVEGRATVILNPDGTRTVKSSWGEATVPADPQRVVSVIGDIDLETMLALGMKPVAAGTQGGTLEEGFAPHIAHLVDGIEPLAWADGAPAEQILALEPDLVFAPRESEYDLFGEVVATVPRGAWNGEWKQDFRYIAAVLGRSSEAEVMLADFESRAADLRERIDARWGEVAVAAGQIYSDHAQVGLDGPISFSTEIFTELGLEVIPLALGGNPYGIDLSLERLPEIDADHLFWQVRQDENGEPDLAGVETLRGSPLWERVSAVAAGQVYFVDNRPWYFPTILGAHVILDDIEEALLGANGVSGDVGTRTVRHAIGTSEVPARPRRVVVLDTGELDSVTALGVAPVGAVRAPVEAGFLDYLSADTADTVLVGTISEPDLEAIAALDPDLILSSKLRHEGIYDQLSQIAPTVFTETVGVVWKENFLVHAEALGQRERAVQMLADYEARAAELGDRLASELGQLPTISMVRFLPGQTRLYQKASFIGTVLDDVGLPRPPSQDVDAFAAEIGPEQVAMADGDIIFWTAYGPQDDTTFAEMTGTALWSNLDAVRQGRVYAVPDDHWMLGIGIRAANLVLDDLESILLEGGG